MDDQQMTDLIRKCLGDFPCKTPEQPAEQLLPANDPFGTNQQSSEESLPKPNVESSTETGYRKGSKRNNEDENSDQDKEEDEEAEDDDENSNKTKPKVVWGVSGNRLEMVNKKSTLLRLACDLYAGHKWNSFLQMAHALILNTRLPGFILMKNFLLFLNYKSPISPEDLAVASHFIHDVLFMMEERYDTLNELALYLIHNKHLIPSGKIFLNDLWAKVEKIGKRGLTRRIRENNLPKSFVLLRAAFDINKELIDYHEWKSNHSNLIDGYSSSQMDSIKINKMISNFRRILNEAQLEELSMDIVALVLMELYDYECDLIETKNMFEEYSEKFPNNLNGHVYLYEFLSKYRDIEYDPLLKINALKQIVRLCPDSKYLLKLIKNPPKLAGLEDPLKSVEMLCNFLDYKSNLNSYKAWKCLYQTVKTMSNIPAEDDWNKLRSYFQWKLYYWQRLHFDLNKLQPNLPEFHRFYRMNSRKHSDLDFSSEASSSNEEFEDDRKDSTSFTINRWIDRKIFQTILCKGKFLKLLEQNNCLKDYPKLLQYKDCIFNV